MKRWHVGDESLNRLVGTAAMVALASIWLCVAAGLFFGFLERFVSWDVFVNFFWVLIYVGLPLAVLLGWYAVYRVWKRYFYRKSIANIRQIIRLLGSLVFVALVAFCTYLLVLVVSYVVSR
jgi:hypothetical protein